MDFSQFKIAEHPKPIQVKKEKRYIISHDPFEGSPDGVVLTVWDNDERTYCFRTTLTAYSRFSDWMIKLKTQYKPSTVQINDISKRDFII